MILLKGLLRLFISEVDKGTDMDDENKLVEQRIKEKFESAVSHIYTSEKSKKRLVNKLSKK